MWYCCCSAISFQDACLSSWWSDDSSWQKLNKMLGLPGFSMKSCGIESWTVWLAYQWITTTCMSFNPISIKVVLWQWMHVLDSNLVSNVCFYKNCFDFMICVFLLHVTYNLLTSQVWKHASSWSWQKSQLLLSPSCSCFTTCPLCWACCQVSFQYRIHNAPMSPPSQ